MTIEQRFHEFKPDVSLDEVDALILAAKAFFNLHRNHFYGSASDFTTYQALRLALERVTGKVV